MSASEASREVSPAVLEGEDNAEYRHDIQEDPMEPQQEVEYDHFDGMDHEASAAAGNDARLIAHDESTLTLTATASCLAASCRTLRDELHALRAHVVYATGEQTKWILKMNRLVKKVVPSVVASALHNTAMSDEERQWVQIAEQQLHRQDSSTHSTVSPQLLTALSSSSASVSPRDSTLLGQLVGPLQSATTPLASWTPLENREHGRTPNKCELPVNHQQHYQHREHSAEEVACEQAATSSRRASHHASHADSMTSCGVQRNVASASSASHHSLVLPSIIVPSCIRSHSSGAVDGDKDIGPGATLAVTTTTPRAARAAGDAAGKAASYAALSAMGNHIHRLEQQQQERLAQQQFQDGQGGPCVMSTKTTHHHGGPRRTAPHPPSASGSGGGPAVLTLMCFGAASNEAASSSSPLRIASARTQHPWTLGTSARHAQLLEEAELAATLHVTSLQLRNTSPSRVDALVSQYHASTSMSTAAVTGYVSSPDETSGTADGIQTVTPFTSYYQQNLQNMSAPKHDAIGTAVMRSTGAAVVTARPASPPSAPQHMLAIDLSTRDIPAPPSRQRDAGGGLSHSARIKRGLAIANPPSLAATAVAGSANAQPFSARVPARNIAIRGGGMSNNSTLQHPAPDRQHGAIRNRSAMGLTAWTPPAIVGSETHDKRRF
jgi:hypothetical protein